MEQVNQFSQGVDNFTQGAGAKRQSFNAGQAAQEQGFLDKYTNAINSQETLPMMYDRIGRELNLPALREQGTKLTTTFQNIPYTYQGATKGYNVNANQLDRIIGQKSSEMAPTVQSVNNALNSAEGELSRRMGFEQADQQKKLLPFEKESDFLTNRLAREATGYSEDNQNELTTLLQKMSAGIQLSEGEKNRANQLALAEINFKNQLALQKDQQNFTSSQGSGSSNLLTLGEGTTVFDPNTGRPIYTSPKTYAPTGGGSSTFNVAEALKNMRSTQK